MAPPHHLPHLLLLLPLLLGLLSSCNSLPPPRTSFLLDSADRPLLVFALNNATSLLLSDDGLTLFVGARDAVFSLDVSGSDVITLKRKVTWSPTEKQTSDCEQKGKNRTVDCPNFVRVLQPLNSTHLYACGSFAYSPQEAVIETETFSLVDFAAAKTRARCPFNPFQRNAATIIDGELFTATTTDFRGAKPEISRHLSRHQKPDVSQDMTVSLLEEPTFVSVASSDRKLYFFFSEVGNEFSFVDELKIARVAQVCKDDVGGQRTLQRKWTSFAKASLLCPSQKRLPFSVLQDMFTLQPAGGSGATDTLFYGVFTSQWSSSPQSAVCVFRLQDVTAAFDGGYRTFDMRTHLWSSRLERHAYLGQCGLDSAPDADLVEVKKSFLTSDPVKPLSDRPVLVSAQTYSRVVAMTTEAANGRQYTVLFLLTESGFLHKVVLSGRGPHVIEEVQVFTEPQPVPSLILSPAKGVLFVGTSGGVTSVPVSRCSVYSSCSQCVLARDPQCLWSRSRRICTGDRDQDQDMAQDVEDGNVEEQCGGTRSRADTAVTEVSVHLSDSVRLRCTKPSNLASLTWTFSRYDVLPDKLFIQSPDGSLSFLATADTLGPYRCWAKEGGYTEVVVSYRVRQIASPRSVSPKHDEPVSVDEEEEDLMTEKPATTDPRAGEDATIGEVGESEDDVMDSEEHGHTTERKHDTADAEVNRGLNAPSSIDSQTSPDLVEPKTPVVSYYSELVTVSLLLAVCLLILVVGGALVWRQRETVKPRPLMSPDDHSKTNHSMESVPSLSSPDEPEVKVMA